MSFFNLFDSAGQLLKGKTAIVTGGSRGIGSKIAIELARRGANVIIISSQENAHCIDNLRTTITGLPSSPDCYFFVGNLRSIEGPRIVMTKMLNYMRDNKISFNVDILVNNAGVTPAESRARQSLQTLDIMDFDYIYNLNVRGMILMTQAVLPHLVANGRIINIASIGSRIGIKDMSLFCSSKAAVEGLTRCWAQELGYNGTTVNAVSPGFIEGNGECPQFPRDMVLKQKEGTPLYNRVGTAEEVTKVVAWLAGEDSKWVTGQTISASGGYAMW